MENIIYKIKHHWVAISVAIILGVTMIAPIFYFQAKLNENFRGIPPKVVNDVDFYYARIKDVVDGHSFLSNAYLFEHKNGLPQQVFFAEWLLAQPIKIFNLNINIVHLIYNFLLPAVAFILTYLALFLISKSRFWSTSLSVFLFFGLYLLSFIQTFTAQIPIARLNLFGISRLIVGKPKIFPLPFPLICLLLNFICFSEIK